MANKRNLKKYIHYITDELVLETIVISGFSPVIDQERINALLSKILHVKDEFLARVSGCGDKSNVLVRKYFSSLKFEFNQAVGEILDELNDLHSPGKK